MRKFWALSFFSLAVATPLLADFKSTWPLDGRIGAINSQVPGRTAEDNLKSSGGDLELHFSPILGWTQSRWLLLPELDINTNSANTILKVEDERFVFLAQSTTNLELGGAFRRTSDQRFGVKLFAGGFQGKEAANETLETGQYNYQDGGINLDWRQKWDTGIPFRSTVGLRSTDRKYPNWQSLDPAQRHEKDQKITKLYTDMEWSSRSLQASTLLGLSTQSITYVDAPVVDAETGLTTDAKRKENVTDFSLSVPFSLGRHGLEPRLSSEIWASNMNYYDKLNGVMIEHYNGFFEVTGGLGYSYDFKGPWSFLDSPQVTLDLDLTQRQYSQRWARNSNGTLKDVKEWDFARNVALGFNSAFSEHWGLYTKFTSLYASSNNDDQSSSLYNYMFNTFTLGVNFVY